MYGIGPSRSATGSASFAERAELSLGVVDRTGRDGDQRDHLLAVPLLGHHRQRRCGRQVHRRRDVVRHARRPLAEQPQQLGVVLGREEDQPGVHDRPDRVQGELELRDDAEVAAAAAQAPEQVGVLALAGVHEAPVGGDHVGATRLSQARPCLRISQPIPPPSVKPATPVVDTSPPVVASACACVSWSTSPQTAPGPTYARCAFGSTRTERIAERSMTIPSSQLEKPAMLCPPPRTAIARSLLRAKPTAAITSAAPLQPTITAGRRVVERAVPDPARLGVAVVVGAQDAARESLRAAPAPSRPRAPGRLLNS